MTPCRPHRREWDRHDDAWSRSATTWSVPHADTDDYFWAPTSPPYSTKRDETDRLRPMHELFVGREAWVLSGTLMWWGDSLAEHFDAVVFLSLDHDERVGRSNASSSSSSDTSQAGLQDRSDQRLHAREVTRYGISIEFGGSRATAHHEFMQWAGGYEDPDFDGRNRARHEAWLGTLPCTVLRLDSARPVDELVKEIIEFSPPGAHVTS